MRIGRGVVGVLLVLIGAVWFLQGIGTLGGSSMSGARVWAVIGALAVVLGAGMLIGLFRQGRGRG